MTLRDSTLPWSLVQLQELGEQNSKVKRRVYLPIIVILLIAPVLSSLEKPIWGADSPPGKQDQISVKDIQTENLLTNGNMEEGFYWKYPNHYVANGWKRWWIGNVIPEYDDVREWRPWRYDGHHAQIYFWYYHYTAGIFQQVATQPCTPYQFSMYGRNHSGDGADHHARIGIDPLGREYGRYISSLPSDITWSPEQTFFYTWGLHTVTAEALDTTITGITHVSPDANYAPYDTFWDAGTLTQVPFPNNRLPEPDSWESSEFINNVTTQMGAGHLIVEWDTLQPASTQAWYDIIRPADPITPGHTLLLSHAWYLPLIAVNRPPDRDFEFATPLDTTPTTHHRIQISSLNEGEKIKFVLLSRHRQNNACTTEVYGPTTTINMPPITFVYLPILNR